MKICKYKIISFLHDSNYTYAICETDKCILQEKSLQNQEFDSDYYTSYTTSSKHCIDYLCSNAKETYPLDFSLVTHANAIHVCDS